MSFTFPPPTGRLLILFLDLRLLFNRLRVAGRPVQRQLGSGDSIPVGLRLLQSPDWFIDFVLLAVRLLLGIGESVAYPSYSKIVARHFPEDRRGSPTR